MCAYCREARGNTIDHFIKSAHAKRSWIAAKQRKNTRFQVPACNPCNMAVYTRNRVPVGYEHLIPELEEITGGKYATWSGDPADLREVVK